MSHRAYKYPKTIVVPQYVFLLVAIFMFVFAVLAIVAGLSELFNGNVNSQGDFLPVIFVIVFCFLIQFAGVYIFFRFPNIDIKDNGFRLKKFPFFSEWVEWENIESIQRSGLSETNDMFDVDFKIYNVKVPKLGIQYGIVGYFAGIDGRGFMIMGSKMNRFDEVLGRFQTYRPDLFEEKIL